MSSNVSGTGGTPQQPSNKSVEGQPEQVPADPEDVEALKQELKGKKSGEKKPTTQPKEPSLISQEGSEVKQALGKGATREGLLGPKEGQKEGAKDPSMGEPKTAKDRVVKEVVDSAKQKQEGPAPIQGQQVPSAAPAAGPAGVSAAGPAAPASSVQEMSQLATAMIDKMLASDAASTAGKEVRMTFGDANPNLKGVEVTVKMDGNNLQVRFAVDTPEATNYIAQNQGLLNDALKKEMPDLTNINVDIQEPDSDTEGQDRQSKGEYIPEDTEE